MCNNKQQKNCIRKSIPTREVLVGVKKGSGIINDNDNAAAIFFCGKGKELQTRICVKISSGKKLKRATLTLIKQSDTQNMQVVRNDMSNFITKCQNPNLAPLINNGGKSLITNDPLSGVNGGNAAGGGGRDSSTGSISSSG